jgi:hypothetical protein
MHVLRRNGDVRCDAYASRSRPRRDVNCTSRDATQCPATSDVALEQDSAVFWLVQCLFTSAQETAEGIEHDNAQGLYAIGHSSKHPWPKRKNPTEPASTTATTIIFRPCLSAINGFVRAGAAKDAEGTAPKNLRRKAGTHGKEGRVVGAERGLEGVAFSSNPSRRFTGFAGRGGSRLRGCGNGSSGREPKRTSNSCSVGIGVVCALILEMSSDTCRFTNNHELDYNNFEVRCRWCSLPERRCRLVKMEEDRVR